MRVTPVKRILILVTLIAAALVLVGGGWAMTRVNQRFKGRPLDDFLSHYPQSGTYYWIDGEEGRQLVALVPSDDFLPSGRACFVFGENGQQLWFFSDSGEGCQPADRIVDLAIREGARVTKEELLRDARSGR